MEWEAIMVLDTYYYNYLAFTFGTRRRKIKRSYGKIALRVMLHVPKNFNTMCDELHTISLQNYRKIYHKTSIILYCAQI